MQSLDERLPQRMLRWYQDNHRQLPWRKDREPYHVWLSEIMLQQTRVEAVKGYYERFLQQLPDIASLAACEPDRLAKLWEGLGYYSRMRNLQKAAITIMRDHDGVFPSSYEQIRALPGIGDYTAGAIGSICFELPTPAVDGNVLRVLSRVTQDDRPVDQQQVKKDYAQQLREIYPIGHCGDFTQSLMELGGTVCLPNGQPKCESCPIVDLCKAYAAKTQMRYPVKAQKKARRLEKKTVFLLSCESCVALRKRPKTGLLAGLWELPNLEGEMTAQEAIAQCERWGVMPQELIKTSHKTHIFTHVQWDMCCYDIRCNCKADCFVWADAQRFAREIALPTAFKMFYEEEAR